MGRTTGRRGVAPGRFVSVSVADTGVGMSEQVKAHVFEPFFTTKEVGQGAGLGLATCYGIVKQHGGDISIESSPGHGAKFIVKIPAKHTPEDLFKPSYQHEN